MSGRSRSAKVEKAEKICYPGAEGIVEYYNDLYHRTEPYGNKRKIDEKPDFIGGAPNYDKFRGWPVEKVLGWLNID